MWCSLDRSTLNRFSTETAFTVLCQGLHAQHVARILRAPGIASLSFGLLVFSFGASGVNAVPSHFPSHRGRCGRSGSSRILTAPCASGRSQAMHYEFGRYSMSRVLLQKWFLSLTLAINRSQTLYSKPHPLSQCPESPQP